MGAAFPMRIARAVEQIVLALAGRNPDRFLARIDDMAERVAPPAQAL